MRLIANELQTLSVGKRVDHRDQVPGVGRRAVGNAHAQLDQRRCVEQPLLDHLLHEPEVAGIEHFELGFHAEVAGDLCALAQVVRRRDVGAVVVAEVQAAAVEGRDVGSVQSFVAQVDHVLHALFLRHEVAAWRRRVLETVLADARCSRPCRR